MSHLLRYVPAILLIIVLPCCKGKNEVKITSYTTQGPQRQMRPPGPPPDPEEMRRQRNIARAANIEWIKTSTEKYSPYSWYLLMHYDALPETNTVPAENGVASTKKNDETFRYLRGRTKNDMLASMEKNVHEIAHAFFDQNAFSYIASNNLILEPGNAQGYVYITPSSGFFVSFPMKAMFPSRELSRIIPGDLRTYRFNTYIEGTTSTQSEGIIGLLNELDAYYIGSRYCYDMLEPYKTAASSDSQGLFEWVTNTQSTMSAYYEFDYYIMEYLHYMKKNYPENYDLLVSYKSFSDAYGNLRKLYKELISSYMEKIRNEMKLINSSHEASARLEKGWLWIKADKSNVASGTPVFSDPREKLMPVLESRKYRDIDNDLGLR